MLGFTDIRSNVTQGSITIQADAPSVFLNDLTDGSQDWQIQVSDDDLNFISGGTTYLKYDTSSNTLVLTGSLSVSGSTSVGGFTANRVMQSDGSGNLTISEVTSTELNYLDGVTSSIQSQLNTDSGNLSTHLSDTTAHGTTGDVVGTTDTQTLTNKNITLPIITPTSTAPSSTGQLASDSDERNVLKYFDGTSELRVSPFINVKEFGAVGDNSTNDASAVNTAISALTSGGTLYFPNGTYILSTDITCSVAGIKLLGETTEGVVFKFPVGEGVSVTANNFTLENITLDGTDHTSSSAVQTFNATGTDNSTYLKNILIKNCTIKNNSDRGVQLKWVENFRIEGTSILDSYEAGIYLVSCRKGVLDSLYIRGVDEAANLSGNGYGITVTSGVGDNACTDIQHSNILIEDCTNWTAFDSHYGSNLQYVNCTSINSKYGIALQTRATHSLDAMNVSILGCTLIGGVSGSDDGVGIDIAGDSTGDNATTQEMRELVVMGNNITGFGKEDNALRGGIRVRDTVGLSIIGNNIKECSPNGVVFLENNYGATCTGNTIVDCFTNEVSVAEAIGIYVSGDYNEIELSSNKFLSYEKSATYVMTENITVAGTTGMNIKQPVIGPSTATDNRLARFDTDGLLLQNSAITVDDSGNISGAGTLGVGAITSSGALAAGSSGGTNTLTGSTHNFSYNANGQLLVDIENANAGGSASTKLRIGSSAATDSFIQFVTNDANTYSIGLDHSTDAFTVSESSSLGSNIRMAVSGTQAEFNVPIKYDTVQSTINVNTGFTGAVAGLTSDDGVRKFSNAGTKTINGIVPGEDGQEMVLINSGGDMTISNESGSATGADHRIITGTGADVTITADGAASLRYDEDSSRWRLISVQT